MNYCDILTAAELQLSVEYTGVVIKGHFVELVNHYYNWKWMHSKVLLFIYMFIILVTASSLNPFFRPEAVSGD